MLATLLILLPVAGALLVAILPLPRLPTAGLAFLISLVEVGLWIVAAGQFDFDDPAAQLGTSEEWVESLGISYSVGFYGFSIWLAGVAVIVMAAAIGYATWVAARKLGETGRAAVDALFSDIDVILTAPAPGEAPVGLATTGKATFNLLWTYLWMPCVTLPFTKGPTGLPVGIQLVGRQHEDATLLDIAGWVRAAL